MEQNNKLFLLDAYALIYRSYYAFIRNPRINSKGFNTSAVLGFVNTLEEVLRKGQPTHIGVAFDPKGKTFRHEAYKEYKAQREESPEDIKLSVPIIKKIIDAYQIPIVEVEHFEADDAIGTLAKQASEMGIETYMMTPDKDYAQLVSDNVFMFKPKHGSSDYEILGVEEVKDKYQISSPSQVIDLLALMGDTADNIPGCPGVGPKTAQKLIAQFGSVEGLLQNTDKLKGALKKKVEDNKEEIEFSKFLVTINTEVPVQLNLEEYKRKPLKANELKAILEEMEFKNLTERIFREQNVEVKPKSQPSLFDAEPTKETVEPKSESYEGFNMLKQDYQLVDNVKNRASLVGYLKKFQKISFDTETTDIDPINAQLVGMSFSVKENEAFYIPIPQEENEAKNIVSEFSEIFENNETTFIGQNLKYDLLVLKKYNINISGKLFDTMVAHYVLQPELQHNMDYLAEIYLNYKTIHIDELIGKKGKDQKNMKDLPPSSVYTYACEDADITLKLKNILEKELKEKNVEEVFYNIEMPLLPVLVEMENNGVRLDTEALAQSSKEFKIKLQAIEQDIHQLANNDTFNVSSPKQVGEVLFDQLKIDSKAKKTKKGQYVTSEEVLESYKGKHPIIEKILEFRGLKKLLSTYIDALPKLINPKTDRIHTSFNQTITSTGRLSSSNPNLQNIPIRDDNGKEIRKAFVPEEGCEFFSADYSQIELRIMAHMSNDEGMVEAFNSNKDIHQATAAKIYKINHDEVTSDMRRKAKTANFGIIYGISVFGLAERMNVERKEAKELIDGYFESYPRVKEYMSECVEYARQNECVETIFHRKRYLPDINSRNGVVRGYAERNAINAPIQGSAADIIKIAMANIFNRFKNENVKAKMILQVHDELNFSVPVAEKKLVEKIVIEEMENAYRMKVPLKADCGWGKNWLEAH